MSERYKYSQAFSIDSRKVSILPFYVVEHLFAVLILTAPYYWIPVIPVAVWSTAKTIVVITLSFVFIVYLIKAKETVIFPDRTLALLIFALPFALLPGLVRITTIGGIQRYIDYILLVPVFVVYITIVRQRGIAALRRYRHYVVLAMIPQVLYVFLAGVGLIEPIAIPSVFRTPVEPHGAGFSAVQTQFSISIALIVPLLVGYVISAFERGQYRGILWLMLLAPVIVAFIESHGRSGMLAAMTGTMTFVYLYRRRLAVYLTGVGIIAAAGLLYYYRTVVLQYTKLAYGLNDFTSNRLTLFSDAFELFIDVPVLGLGFGNRPFAVDNLYLGTIVESGFLPGVLMIVFVVVTVVTGYRIVRRFRRTEHEILAASLFGAVVSYVPVTLFERGVIFLNFFLNVGWWVCLGSLLMLLVLDGERNP